MELRDRTGSLGARMWNITEQSVANVTAGEFAHARGKVQLFQGGLQVILTHIVPVSPEGLDLTEFLPQPKQDAAKYMTRLQEILLSLDDPAIRMLMQCFIDDRELMEKFSLAPAGTKTHHAYQGGLLEHVTTMLEIGTRIGPLYPDLKLDVLLAGIFLHDLGKVRELSYDCGFGYTSEGQLLGHMMIGVEMLAEKIRDYEVRMEQPFPTETMLRLKHIIISHHGSYEFGSMKLPMTPEAIALHHIDNLDAKLHEFMRDIQNDPNPGSDWTPFSTRLDRKLYKGAR
ncbi:MAG: HD domain-containing protein [Planctomycetales bacterium]